MKKKIFILLTIVSMLFINLNIVMADTYDNIDPDAVVSCGGGLMDGIPSIIPKVSKIAYTIIQVAVPVVLVIMGSLDLVKGIYSTEEEMKKGQKLFIKRLIAAALVFFTFVIVKVVISVVADGTGAQLLECTECFINNNCD